MTACVLWEGPQSKMLSSWTPGPCLAFKFYLVSDLLGLPKRAAPVYATPFECSQLWKDAQSSYTLTCVFSWKAIREVRIYLNCEFLFCQAGHPGWEIHVMFEVRWDHFQAMSSACIAKLRWFHVVHKTERRVCVTPHLPHPNIQSSCVYQWQTKSRPCLYPRKLLDWDTRKSCAHARCVPVRLKHCLQPGV